MENVNKKILFVEDDKDFLLIIKTKFTNEGFTVLTAEDGEQGKAVAETEKPDLIFTDILLPKMDGMEMAKKIKETNKDAKIIFLSNTKEMEVSGEFECLIKADTRLEDIVKKAKEKLGLV